MKRWMRHAALLALFATLAACGGSPAGPGGDGNGNGGDTGVTGVSVTPATGTVPVSGNLSLSATVEPAGASQAVTWTTSSTAVATVDANGVVTGVGPATVTITATSQADPSRSASATLEVFCQTYAADALPSFITSDVTVPPGCHDLSGTKRVTSGATLTFQSPSEIRAVNDGAGFRVEDGTLRALGTDVTTIRFTATSAAPGSWLGFRVLGDGAATFDHTTIEYAGSWTVGFHVASYPNSAVRVEPGGTLALDGVTIRATQTEAGRRGAGLFVERGASVTMTGDNRFVQNAGPGVSVTAAQIPMLSPDADYGAAPAANGNNVVLVNATASAPPVVTGQPTWPALNVPYRVVRTVDLEGAGTIVTIAPGARFEFASDAGIRVSDGAALSAIGGPSAAERIVFSGAQATPGAWPGLHINTTNAANELRFTDIAFAGQNSLSFNPVGGGGIATSVRVGDGVGVGAGEGQPASLTFVGNVVRQSAGSGIRLEHPSTTLTPAVAELAAQNDFQSATIADADIDDAR